MNNKKFLILILLVLAILMLIGATQAWTLYQLIPGAAAKSEVTATGQEGLPALMPIAVALLAIGVTLTIAGRVMRVFLAVLIMLFGGWLVFTTFGLLAGSQPELITFGAAVLHDVTGFAPSEHASLVQKATSSLWPTVMFILGAMTIFSGVLVLIFSARWQTAGRKYDSPRARVNLTGETDRISEWDSQNDGADPSDLGHTEYGSPDGSFTR